MDHIKKIIKDWLVHHNFIEPKEKSTILLDQLLDMFPHTAEMVK